MTSPDATSENPFAQVEALLQDPPVDGAFVTVLKPGGLPAQAGLLVGDVIVVVGETSSAELPAFYQAMQPTGEEDTTREVTVVRAGAEVSPITIPAGLKGMAVCAVKAGQCAWTNRPDYEGEPDFSRFSQDGEICLRNSFGEETAGFEWLRMRRRGDLLEVETVFRLGGDGEPHGRWDYCTRADSAHRLDRWLSSVRTAFWEGLDEAEVRSGAVALEEDGMWRGVRRAEDREEDVEFAPASPSLMNSYSALLLPLTMPLCEGACQTFTVVGDGSGIATGRARFECMGREMVKVAGSDVPAWRFGWRHYGHPAPADDEQVFVTDDRRLVRIEWGPGYGGCWCEEVPWEETMETIPAHVRLGVCARITSQDRER